MPHTSPDTALCWLRNDLRLDDNPALAYALRHHAKVLCVYIDSERDDADPPAKAWWLRGALLDLQQQLQGRLLYRVGEEQAQLQELISQFRIAAVYWNRRYEPGPRERDAETKQWLAGQGVRVASFPGNLLFEPWEVAKADDTPYRVFTPFYKAARTKALVDPQPGVAAADLARLVPVPPDAGQCIEDIPRRAWMNGFATHWQPTREAALRHLEAFAAGPIASYADARNMPAAQGCSQMSPYLHFGQLSPREIACRVSGLEGAEPYLRELIWREFAFHIQYHWPQSVDQPMDLRFERMAWRKDEGSLVAWQRGQTGIPMVDAGMRELWHTGFMHNRLRMVVASFLCKHLLIDWREGARWFEYTLLDADLANNRMGWQWSAGSGVDAAPYFRIFNPVAQGQRFDSRGAYVRRWLPELARLPGKWVHQPWEASTVILQQAGVVLGGNYPNPIIDLKAGRQRALQLWEQIKG